LADSLMNLINEDSNFGELAKKFSIRKWSAENEGVLGYAPASKFGSYKDLFWNSKVGEIIGPVEIEGIYGIFRILGKQESKPYDFNAVKDEVLKESQIENQTEIIQNYLNVIQSKVQVKINEQLLESIVITG
jgi:parvulin-like peptidyl-prolyl isomerase